MSVSAVEVWCPTCHRREAWGPAGERRVVTEGGGRKPSAHPDLAAWRVIARSKRGELGRVVARCPACGLPMVTSPSASLPAILWTLELPDRRVDLDPDAPLDEALGAQLESLYRPRWAFRPGTALFQGCLVAMLIGPFAVWVCSGIYTTWFIANVFAH